MSRPVDPVVPMPEGCEALEPFARAAALNETAIQVAGVIKRTMPDTSHEALLAAALCVRALQLGHACVEIDRVADSIDTESTVGVPRSDARSDVPSDPVELPWPDPVRWAEQLSASAAVATHPVHDTAAPDMAAGEVIRPLVFDGTRVYLQRYWLHERTVGDALLHGMQTTSRFTPGAPDDRGAIEAVLDRYFGPAVTTAATGDTGAGTGDTGAGAHLQREAAATALSRKVAIIAGGPGTGKTHTVARLLAAMHHLALDSGRTLEVALTAPTGKAAARMTQAVHEAVARAQADEGVHLPPEVAAALVATEAGTIHRLLGGHGGITFSHDRDDPLPHDVVVVDETSMVDLPLMARLLDALGPQTRLVLVGDPFQLASVEAGAVLGDVVGPAARGDAPGEGPLRDAIVVLRRVHRFGEDSAIAELARAIRTDDPDRTMDLLAGSDASEVDWVDPGDTDAIQALHAVLGEHARKVLDAACRGEGDQALGLCRQLKVLCGTRFASRAWTQEQERRLDTSITGSATAGGWYPGRPVIVTRNDYITGVFNGDTGVVIDDDGRLVVAMEGPGGIRRFAPSQLADVATWWAMTIHRSQGSEFDHAIVSLPGATSPVLTNELLYTAVTRAREKVTVVADEDSIRAAVGRRIARASGLGARLWP